MENWKSILKCACRSALKRAFHVMPYVAYNLRCWLRECARSHWPAQLAIAGTPSGPAKSGEQIGTLLTEVTAAYKRRERLS
jgi:hypothetical protein